MDGACGQQAVVARVAAGRCRAVADVLRRFVQFQASGNGDDNGVDAFNVLILMVAIMVIATVKWLMCNGC